MSLLKQKTRKNNQIYKKLSDLDININNSNLYEVNTIQDNADYISEKKYHLSYLYYLLVWKAYSRKKNI